MVKKILKIDESNAISEKKVALHFVKLDVLKKGGCPKNSKSIFN
jgi:hypothetical protein